MDRARTSPPPHQQQASKQASSRHQRHEPHSCARAAKAAAAQQAAGAGIIYPRYFHALSIIPYCSSSSSSSSSANAASLASRKQLPSVIHGDLDSLRDDVRDWYASRGVPISRDLDQYSTDFGKAIKKVTVEHCNRTAGAGQTKNGCTESRDGAAGQEHTANGVEQDGSGDAGTDILILCTLAGRVDQGLGLLYEMLRTHNQHNALRLWLFSESSVSFILPPGENRIAVRAGFFTENVGILPAFGPATISTSGLEWDVSDWYTCVTGNVSTSNHVKAEEVVVRTDASVLFTIEREERLP